MRSEGVSGGRGGHGEGGHGGGELINPEQE